MKTRFPAVLYVVVDPDSKDTIADEDPRALSYPDGEVPMARYVLAGTGEVSNKTTYEENEIVPELRSEGNAPLYPYGNQINDK